MQQVQQRLQRWQNITWLTHDEWGGDLLLEVLIENNIVDKCHKTDKLYRLSNINRNSLSRQRTYTLVDYQGQSQRGARGAPAPWLVLKSLFYIYIYIYIYAYVKWVSSWHIIEKQRNSFPKQIVHDMKKIIK